MLPDPGFIFRRVAPTVLTCREDVAKSCLAHSTHVVSPAFSLENLPSGLWIFNSANIHWDSGGHRLALGELPVKQEPTPAFFGGQELPIKNVSESRGSAFTRSSALHQQGVLRAPPPFSAPACWRGCYRDGMCGVCNVEALQ